MEVSLVLGYDLQRLRKWREGREKYGPVFIGHPVKEAYEELLDLGNYFEQCARDNCLLPDDINALDDMVRAIVLRLAEAVARKREFDAGTSA